MKTATEKRIAFRNMLKSGEIIVAPGIGDALSAKIAAYAGIKALTMGGYSVSASRLGQPDVGFLSCTEMAEQLTGICNATDLPVVADGDTGYGNALNVIRTEQMFEQAGAACIFFEDQAWPKRCGHMDGKQVISAEEHAQKIRAAVDARLDKETMIMSRTDSRAVYGIDDAIERTKRYIDAGAEICFADGIGTREELEKFAKELSGSAGRGQPPGTPPAMGLSRRAAWPQRHPPGGRAGQGVVAPRPGDGGPRSPAGPLCAAGPG